MKTAAGGLVSMRRWTSPLLSGIFLVLVILAWTLFLPIQFGGGAAYVIISGASMEPLYHSGDLVIVRRDSFYGVGDIVTYYSAELDKYVIHRIVAVKEGNFTFKGDNNAWLDPETLSRDQLIGKAWLHIPGFGRALIPFRTPLGLALLAGAVALVVFLALMPGKKTRKKTLTHSSYRFFTGGATMKELARQLEITIFSLAIIFVLFAALGLVAFTRDEYLSETVSLQYIHLGRFSYSAPQSGVYPSGSAAAGEPIFLKAGCQVELRFGHSLMADSAENVTGNITLNAQAEAGNGWKRAFPLVARQEFSGTETNITASLNICEILKSLREVESVTSVRRDIYTFIITPEVKINALISGQPVESTFSPRLLFTLDDLQLVLLREDPERDPLLPLEVKEIATNTRIPNAIRLPGFSLTVGLARVISGLGLAATLLVGGFVVFSLNQSIKKNPLDEVAVKYGGMVVAVMQFPPQVEARAVQTASIDDLARLAEQHGTVILHVEGQESDQFGVETGQAFYVFDLPKGGGNVR